MKFDPEAYKNFGRSQFIITTVCCWIFGVFLIYVAFDSGEDYQVTRGTVVQAGYTEFKGRATNYVYCIKLSNRQQPFAIKTNKERVPILDKSFKGVETGDFIQLTFEENWATRNESVNMMVREIRRKDVVLYDVMPTGEFWNGRMQLGLGIIGFSFIPFIILLLFERKYRKHKRLTT